MAVSTLRGEPAANKHQTRCGHDDFACTAGESPRQASAAPSFALRATDGPPPPPLSRWRMVHHSLAPTNKRKKGKEAERRQTHGAWSARKRRAARATDKAACATLRLRARSSAGVPPRLLPEGRWSQRLCFRPGFLGRGRSVRSAKPAPTGERRPSAVTRALPAPACPSPVKAPHTPVVMPAGMMPEAAREPRWRTAARGNRTRSVSRGHRLASFHERTGRPRLSRSARPLSKDLFPVGSYAHGSGLCARDAGRRRASPGGEIGQ